MFDTLDRVPNLATCSVHDVISHSLLCLRNENVRRTIPLWDTAWYAAPYAQRILVTYDFGKLKY